MAGVLQGYHYGTDGQCTSHVMAPQAAIKQPCKGRQSLVSFLKWASGPLKTASSVKLMFFHRCMLFWKGFSLGDFHTAGMQRQANCAAETNGPCIHMLKCIERRFAGGAWFNGRLVHFL
jgi:hypothetical protein